MHRDDDTIGADLADAYRRLTAAAEVPPADPGRGAALLAAFDRAHAPGVRDSRGSRRRDVWYLAVFAAAAAVLVAVLIIPPRPAGQGRSAAETAARGSAARDLEPAPPGDFVVVPGAAALPLLESGTLVRMELPVAVLPSLGLSPPAAGRATVVTADVVVAQDGLPRSVRLVN